MTLSFLIKFKLIKKYIIKISLKLKKKFYFKNNYHDKILYKKRGEFISA